MAERFALRLPATSANLGPGFDAVGLALSMWLSVEAVPADTFSIRAKGRNADVCGDLENSLILATYRDVLRGAGREVKPIALTLTNEIPLGMGCGSSGAALLAGVALADHFGALGLGDAGIVDEASRREGHPDNVATCWYGGFTVSAMENGRVVAATVPVPAEWRILLAMQASSLATKTARALLPTEYATADAVFNVQRTALLTAAFAQGRLDLLRLAMQDRLHQPYRMEACPLLKVLLPLADGSTFAGIALSGAGPSVICFVAERTSVESARARIVKVAPQGTEVLELSAGSGAQRL